MSRSGADLALLMLGGFRSMVDTATEELAARGYEDVRTLHDFALRAIADGADSASELGRRMSVTKQAAARTVAVLEERGYVERTPDPADARRMRLTVSHQGATMLAEGEQIFNDLRSRWEQQIGAEKLAELESTLVELVGRQAIRLDTPGWFAQRIT